MRKTRTCSTCKQDLEINDFYFYKDPGSHTKDGYDYSCKDCVNAQARASYKKNKAHKKRYH